MEATCAQCGKTFERQPFKLKGRKHVFCCPEHYYAWLHDKSLARITVHDGISGKICPHCTTWEPLDEYQSNRSRPDGLACWCNSCARKSSKEHYWKRRDARLRAARLYREAHKEEIRQRGKSYRKTHKKQIQAHINFWIAKRRVRLMRLHGGQCAQCGEDRLWLLTFHHRDPDQKEYNLSSGGMRRLSWDKIIAEANKCDLLCPTCHRIRHTTQNTIDDFQKALEVFRNTEGDADEL